MRDLVVAFGVGVLVGVLYAALRTKSPAPPIVALVGLLGIVVGEQLPSFVAETAWPCVRGWVQGWRAGPD